jgi:transcription initiation factor TFIIF subunit beta
LSWGSAHQKPSNINSNPLPPIWIFLRHHLDGHQSNIDFSIIRRSGVDIAYFAAASACFFVSPIIMSSSSSSPLKKVTAESYGAVNATQVSSECWMIRVPNKLAELWESAKEGTHLGELVFIKGGKMPDNTTTTVKPSLEVHVAKNEESLSSSSPSDIPLHYTFEAVSKKLPTMHPFTRDSSDGSITLSGTVTRTANLQVSSQSDERYRTLLKNRLLSSNVTSNRFVRPVEANELSVRRSGVPTSTSVGFGDAVREYGQRAIQAAEGGPNDADSASRKRKFENKPTQTVVFELFSQQPRWTVKEMKNASGCPEKEIRQVLADVGDFTRSGEHKGTWQLRPEFQKRG